MEKARGNAQENRRKMKKYGAGRQNRMKGEWMMDKKRLAELRQVDTSKVDSFLKRWASGGIVADLVLPAFAGLLLKRDRATAEEVFFSVMGGPPGQIRELYEEEADLWEQAEACADRFTADELEAYALFTQESEVTPRQLSSGAPESVARLAQRLLDVNGDVTVLELCAGTGGFMRYCYEHNTALDYTGVDSNWVSMMVIQVKMYLLGVDYMIWNDDVFYIDDDLTYDRVFGNYPGAMDQEVHRDSFVRMAEMLGISVEDAEKISPDWHFNTVIMEQLAPGGRAVGIMLNGGLWKGIDRGVRKYFLEKGYIEAVVSLPAQLFPGMSVPVTLMVFSHGNDTVRMVDASEFGKRNRSLVRFSDDDVETIAGMLAEDGENSTTVTLERLRHSNYELTPERYIGVVAEEDNGVPLKDLTMNITRGAQTKAEDLNRLKTMEKTPYRYLSLSNIEEGYVVLGDEYLKEIPAELGKYCIGNRMVVTSRTAQPYFKTGIVELQEGEKLLGTGNIFIIEVDEERINPGYLQAYLVSPAGRAAVKRATSGAILATISITRLKNTMIPLPPRAVQDRIASEYMDTVRELCELKRKYREKTEHLAAIYGKSKAEK